MTIKNSSMGDSPRDLLEAQAGFIKGVRITQRATWFPLIVLAVVTFIAIPIERISHKTVGNCGSSISTNTALHFCRIFSVSGLYYWPIALVGAYAVISNFYRIRSRAVGAETGARKYVIPGVVIAIFLSLASYLIFLFTSGNHSILGIYFVDPSNAVFFRLLGPSFSIGFGLLFLALFERNLLLLVFDLFYCTLVLWPPVRGLSTSGFWSLAPYRMIDGAVLLFAGIVFVIMQLRSAKN